MAVMPYLPKSVRRPDQIIKFEWDQRAEEKLQHSEQFHDWVLERDKQDVERVLAGEHTFMSLDSKGFTGALKRLKRAGIIIDGYNYSELTD